MLRPLSPGGPVPGATKPEGRQGWSRSPSGRGQQGLSHPLVPRWGSPSFISVSSFLPLASLAPPRTLLFFCALPARAACPPSSPPMRGAGCTPRFTIVHRPTPPPTARATPNSYAVTNLEWSARCCPAASLRRCPPCSAQSSGDAHLAAGPRSPSSSPQRRRSSGPQSDTELVGMSGPLSPSTTYA